LNFQNDGPTGNAAWFLERLATTDSNLGTLLPNLAQLDFGMMRNAEPNRLSRVVGRWGSTLTGVTFWKVSIKDSDSQEAALRLDSQAKPNRWAELLAQLPKVASKLHSIRVGCLAQYCRDGVHQVAINTGQAEQNNRVPLTMEYGREDMLDLKRFSRMLDEELTVRTMVSDTSTVTKWR
jgi:hypothetical protein